MAPFEKRLKRRIIGREQRFFVATAPGFETLCAGELKALPQPIGEPAVVPGGVQFRGRLHDAYQANLHLRTANRVLMRLVDFKATNFTALEKHLAAVDWELFLGVGAKPRIHVTTRHCRLYHKAAIIARVLTAIEACACKHGNGESYAQHIFVRGVDDRFSISLDSSGSLLYRRGIKTHGGPAPLRETTAAALLLAAGYTGDMPLLDPMCGSGTFAIEAALLAQKIPPGWFRDFTFTRWPAFQAGRWRHLRREAAAGRTANSAAPIWASDTDFTGCRSLHRQLQAHDLNRSVLVCVQDFFNLKPPPEPGVIVLNPPYGHRLGNATQARNLFMALSKRLQLGFNGWQVVLVVPNPRWVDRALARLKTHWINHGGLRLPVLIGRLATGSST